MDALMLVDGNAVSGGGLSGTHVPLPTTARPLPQRTRRTGLDWGQSKPDPDAIARLVRQGQLTVTEEVVEDKRVVRRARKPPAPKRTPGPSAGVTYPPRFDVDKAVELYLSGMSTIAVAAAVGVKHPQSIRNRLAERGIPLRPQAPVKRHNHPVEKVAADYLVGASMRALAVKYSASKGTVKKILVAQGVTLRDDGIPRSQRPERTSEVTPDLRANPLVIWADSVELTCDNRGAAPDRANESEASSNRSLQATRSDVLP